MQIYSSKHHSAAVDLFDWENNFLENKYVVYVSYIMTIYQKVMNDKGLSTINYSHEE